MFLNDRLTYGTDNPEQRGQSQARLHFAESWRISTTSNSAITVLTFRCCVSFASVRVKLLRHSEVLFFVLFGTLKSKNGQNRAFLVFSNLKSGCSFCFHFGAFSMVFLADFPDSYATQYNRWQILLPEPQKISRSSRKNFPRFQKKFLGVPWKVLACVTRSFRLSF